MTSISTNSSVFWSLAYYDALRRNNAKSITRPSDSNLDIIVTEETATINLCNLAIIMPYSRSINGVRMPLSAGAIEGTASILLAAQHLNTGDGSIVPEVQGLNNTCNIRFTSEVFDTQLEESVAADEVIDIITRNDRLPCAFLGAFRSEISIPTSIITGIKGYPQFSPFSTSSRLDDKRQFPLFGRLIPSDDGTSVPFVQYLTALKVNHIAIVYLNDSYGNAYVRGMQNAASEYAPEMKIVPFAISFITSVEEMEKTVTDLRETGFQYFFGIICGCDHYEPLMEEAFRQGIAGTGEHTWFFGDLLGLTGFQTKVFEIGSPLYKATRGTAMIAATGGTAGDRLYDKLSNALAAINSSEEDMDYLRSIQSSYQSEPGFFSYDSPIFADIVIKEPGVAGSVMYDTVIAMGLAACNITRPGINTMTGSAHFQQVLRTQFNGVTGKIVLDPYTGTRDPTSAKFHIINFVEDEANNQSSNTATTFTGISSSIYKGGQWLEIQPFVFNDGSTRAHLDLPMMPVDNNYISTGLRVAGLTVSAFILSLSISLSFWTYRNRKSRVVRASQPFFLHLICLGAFFMGTAIIPLSIDDSIANTQGCSIACMSLPWLLSTGFVISFSALFSKTYRINKIFDTASFKRVTVKILDVMKPMVSMLGVNFLVLSLMTSLDPLYWHRETIAFDKFGRPSETRGCCTSDQGVPYFTAFGVMNVSALILVSVQAYKARNISTEFAESEYIIRVIAVILAACFVGIPIMIIAYEVPQAYYLCRRSSC